MATRIPYPPLRSGTPDERQLSNWLVRAHDRLTRDLPDLVLATAEWNPPNITSGSFATTTMVLEGARLGQAVAIAFSNPLPPGATLGGAVNAPGVITVTLFNGTAGSINLSPGTLRAWVFMF